MRKTKIIANMGKKIEIRDIKIEVPVSIVETTEFPKPAVDTVEPNRVALAELFTAAAVPPPAIMASTQVMAGPKSATVDTITAVPAMVAKGIAMESKRLSTKGM